MKIKFITDSASDLPKTFSEQNDVTILPLTVTFGTDTFIDGVDLSVKEFYDKMRAFPEMPKTSQINEYAFTEAIKGYKNTDTLVVIITLASEMSNTFNSAKAAVDNLDMAEQCILVDSRQVTFSEGALVIEAVKLARKPNITKAELEIGIENLKNKVKIVAMVGDLKYLKNGGRLSASSAMLGSLLHIKPIITIKDKVEVISKQIGVAKSVRYMIDAAKNRDKAYPVYFGHSDCYDELTAFIEKCKQPLELITEELISDLGATVGSHAGPGCFGMVFFEK